MCTHEEAAGILKAAGDTVVLEIQYRPEGRYSIGYMRGENGTVSGIDS